MAVSLYEAGTFTWPEFQAALIARIAAWEAGAAQGEPYNYYRLWLAALEDVLVGLSAVSTNEVTTRTQALAQRHQATTTVTTPTTTTTHTDPQRPPADPSAPSLRVSRAGERRGDPSSGPGRRRRPPARLPPSSARPRDRRGRRYPLAALPSAAAAGPQPRATAANRPAQQLRTARHGPDHSRSWSRRGPASPAPAAHSSWTSASGYKSRTPPVR
ncbi:nitrile hydratase accessory protein [Streptomyces sp. NPDC002405]